MDLSREKPSKNVHVQTAREQALAEYWWNTTNAFRAKAGKGPLDPNDIHPTRKNDPVMKDPDLQEKIDQVMRRKSWYKGV